MKKKIIIGITILLIAAIILTLTISLSADKNKWTIIRTHGRRIWLVCEAERAVVVRWDYYAWDSAAQKYYLTYAESVIQDGENIIMPYTDNIYVKISSDKVTKVEGTKILLSK
jgi:hypothetical protein